MSCLFAIFLLVADFLCVSVLTWIGCCVLQLIGFDFLCSWGLCFAVWVISKIIKIILKQGLTNSQPYVIIRHN